MRSQPALYSPTPQFAYRSRHQHHRGPRGRKQLRLAYNTKNFCAHVQITRIVLIPIQWIAPYLYLVNLVWKTTEIFLPFADGALNPGRPFVRPSHPKHSDIVIAAAVRCSIPFNACWFRILRMFLLLRRGGGMQGWHRPTQRMGSFNQFHPRRSCQHQLCVIEHLQPYACLDSVGGTTSRSWVTDSVSFIAKTQPQRTHSKCQFQVHTLIVRPRVLDNQQQHEEDEMPEQRMPILVTNIY